MVSIMLLLTNQECNGNSAIINVTAAPAPALAAPPWTICLGLCRGFNSHLLKCSSSISTSAETGK